MNNIQISAIENKVVENLEKGLIDDVQFAAAFEEIDILKGGKRAVIGEQRMFAGRLHVKTQDGWKFVGKGKGTKAQEHVSKHTSKHQDPDDDGTHTEIDKYGVKNWLNKNGSYHRDDDKPARIFSDGKSWWKDGKLHRDGDKPAMEEDNGSKTWFKNGKLHRDGDKPAVILDNGTQKWFQNDRRHRDGGKPAVINADGTKEYWEHGESYDPKDKEPTAQDVVLKKLPKDIKAFLKSVIQGQSLYLASWASKIVAKGSMTQEELTRAYKLGFDSEMPEVPKKADTSNLEYLGSGSNGGHVVRSTDKKGNTFTQTYSDNEMEEVYGLNRDEVSEMSKKMKNGVQLKRGQQYLGTDNDGNHMVRHSPVIGTRAFVEKYTNNEMKELYGNIPGQESEPQTQSVVPRVRKPKDASDHLIQESEHHWVDPIDPDTQKVKFKPGDKVKYKDYDGMDVEGVITKDKHPGFDPKDNPPLRVDRKKI